VITEEDVGPIVRLHLRAFGQHRNERGERFHVGQ
jgi:hypothetical protein